MLNILTLKSVHAILGLLTLLVAYLISISCAGYVRAWTAKKMGDSTPEDLGFLTLNPLAHIDIFGILVLILFAQPERFAGYGWGAFIPINPLNIRGHWDKLRLVVTAFSGCFAHFVMSAIAIIGFAMVYGLQEHSASGAVAFEVMTFNLVRAFVTLNVWMLVVDFFINLIFLIRFFYFDGVREQESAFFDVFLLVAPLLMLIFFGDLLGYLVTCALTFVVQGFV